MTATDQKSSGELAAYLSAFEEFNATEKSPSWLADLRRSGITHFTELGFPTLKQEEWVFTNVKPIQDLSFIPATKPTSANIDLGRFQFKGLEGIRLVFVEGHLSHAHSAIPEIPDGIVVSNFAAALEHHGDLVEQHLARYAKTDESGFSALNTAFVQDGAFIYLPKGKVLEQPVHLIFLSTDGDTNTANLRNLIIAEPNSQAKVIESYYSTGDQAVFANVLTEVCIDENASVEHTKFQEMNHESFHVATIQAQLARSSRFTSHSISTGARIARNNINLVMNGEGIECTLNGLYLVGGKQLVDHHTLADHAMPHCDSHEFYHGILGDQSRGIFNGKIFVREDAQKTDAKQSSRAILLSDQATVNAKPQLEIYADDVKCTHGATVGQLNEEAIFYCRSRGIDETSARRMLTHAFAGEVIDRVSIEPVREHLEALIWDRLEELIEH
ncbi:MAG: Fe-S cluster assembly protein SufD [Limisphaerales bacterium]